jgi:hypothetical protein
MRSVFAAFVVVTIALVCLSTVDRTTASATLAFDELRFRSVGPAPGPVEICFLVTNIGDHPYQPTDFRLRAAPLGLFLPWEPLMSIVGPELEPGQSEQICVQAENLCDYQMCAGNEFCVPECTNNHGGGVVGPLATAQAPVLPPPPTGTFPCPPGGWGGNIDIFFNEEQKAVVHNWEPVPAALGHPTYVHVCVGDGTGDIYDWLIVAEITCQGWKIEFVQEDANGQPIPGTEMPDPINNFGCGFICVTPDPNGPGPCAIGFQASNLADEIAGLILRFDSSLCAPTQLEPSTWGRIKGGYR